MRTRRIIFLQLFVGALALTGLGCGGSRGDLSGKVTHKGKALRFGSVTVVGSDNLPKVGEIKEDGTYHIPDILIGEIKASVSSADPASSPVKMRKPGEKPPPVDNKGWFPIPPQYDDHDKSGLKFKINSGPNTWDIKVD